jgi:immune inhibitor A
MFHTKRFQQLTRLALVLILWLPNVWATDPEPVGRKGRDIPNPILKERLDRRLREIEAARRSGRPLALTSDSAALSGNAKALVILVEFGGPDMFTYTPGVSTWDPIGKADQSEWAGRVGDCSIINQQNNITAPRQFTYSGPLHNEIERPRSEADRSGTSVWTPDFNRQYFKSLIDGDGVRYQFNRQDGSTVDVDLTGKTVASYYRDLSNGAFRFSADVYGWVKLPHSAFWYGADPCPGRRSGSTSTQDDGAIPGAGDADSMVRDAIEALKRAYSLNTSTLLQYDQDRDGIIDYLWIIFAGMDEANSTVLLNRTSYGEGTLWAHSGALSEDYRIIPGFAVRPYIMMPENTGLATLAHEFGHALGADDLYAYDGGETSVGLWSLMAETWTGFPLSAVPPAMDPWHLDYWGWLNPLVITDPTQEYTVTVKQASGAPEGTPGYAGVKIQLPTGAMPLTVKPIGTHGWWGGNRVSANGRMTLTAPVALPASPPSTLSFSLAYNIETGWDFLWVQVSDNNGATWTTLRNAHTTCSHYSGWVGGANGFPSNLCAANIGGFTGRNASWPAYDTETFDLAAFAGKQILVRFWYMTDYSVTYDGAFIDNIVISAGSTQLFNDNGEASGSRWAYNAPWIWCDGTAPFSHAYYLQWRNVSATGGFDSGLADPRYRYAPANTGLLVWYNNEFYVDNEIAYYMFDPPSFGPKGRMLVVDAHPEPYRYRSWVDAGYDNERANHTSRSLMRDATFSLNDSVPFTFEGIGYPGRPAVPRFSDSISYYPGLDLVIPDPQAGNVPKWTTRQWDASAVLPSTKLYPAKAPGYTGSEEILWWNADWTRWDSFGTANLGGPGGDGNPLSVGGQYGWNVQIISQTDTHATLRIWNGLYAVNAASFAANAPVAPGSLAAIFGENLAPSSMAAPRMPLPTTLNGVTVTVNGVPAPIHFVSPGQINIQIPYQTAAGEATIAVMNNGIPAQIARRRVEPTPPGIFAYTSAQGQQYSVAWNDDIKNWNTDATPAAPGALLVVFATGGGATTPAIPNGAGPAS